MLFFPRDVLGEILNLIESVYGGFPTYTCKINNTNAIMFRFTTQAMQTTGILLQKRASMKDWKRYLHSP